MRAFLVPALLTLFTLQTLAQPVYEYYRQWGSPLDDEVNAAAYFYSDDTVFAVGNTRGYMGSVVSGSNLGSTDMFLTYMPRAASLLTMQWGTEFEDRATSVDYDAARKLVYVTGWTSGLLPDAGAKANGEDAFFTTSAQLPSGSAWMEHIQWGTDGNDRAACVKKDPLKTDTSAYIAGTTSGSFDGFTNAGDNDAFFSVKHGNTKTFTNYQWGTRGNDQVVGCSMDISSGNFFVAGTTTGAFAGYNNSGGFDAFASFIPRNTSKPVTIQWGTSANDFVTGVTYNPRYNNMIVVGYTEGTFPGQRSSGRSDAFLSVVSVAGGKLSVKTYQWGTASFDYPTSVTLDSLYTNIYVAGYTKGQFDGYLNYGDDDSFISNFVSASPELTPTTYQFGTNKTDRCNAVITSSNVGSVYCLGGTAGDILPGGNLGGKDAFLAAIRKELLPSPVAPPKDSGDHLIDDSGAHQLQVVSMLMVVLSCIYIMFV